MPFLGLDRRESGFSARVDDSVFETDSAIGRVSFEEISRKSCSNVDCARRLDYALAEPAAAIFEGRWACSGTVHGGDCYGGFAAGGGGGSGWRVHRHRIPLGLVMLAQGWITHPQLQAALEAQRASGSGRIGDWLVSECGLEPEQVTRGLSVQWNCPVLSVQGFSPREMTLVIPRQLVEEFGLIPLRVAGGRLLYLGCEESVGRLGGLCGGADVRAAGRERPGGRLSTAGCAEDSARD